MRKNQIAVVVEASQACSECSRTIVAGENAVLDTKKKQYSCLEHSKQTPEIIIPESMPSSDRQILRELSRHSRRNYIRVISTSFFDIKSHKDLTHVVVSTAGVFLINAEDDAGFAVVNILGSLIKEASFKFMVGDKDKTDLINDIRSRVRIAESILDASESPMGVKGVLFLPKAEWPLFGRDSKIGGILLRGDHISTVFVDNGAYTAEQVDATYKALSETLNP